MPVNRNSCINKLSTSRLAYFEAQPTQSKPTHTTNAIGYELSRLADNQKVTTNIGKFEKSNQRQLVRRTSLIENKYLEQRKSASIMGFSIRTLSAEAIINFDRRARILGISSENLTSNQIQRSNSNKATNRNSIIMGLSHLNLLKVTDETSNL